MPSAAIMAKRNGTESVPYRTISPRRYIRYALIGSHRELQGVIHFSHLDRAEQGDSPRESRLWHRQVHVAIGKRVLRHPVGLRERNFAR